LKYNNLIINTSKNYTELHVGREEPINYPNNGKMTSKSPYIIGNDNHSTDKTHRLKKLISTRTCRVTYTISPTNSYY